MIIIADSGSTKTDWWVFSKEEIIQKFKTAGLNPYFVSTPMVEAELTREFPVDINPRGVRKVFFYGAGCSSSEKNKVIDKALKSFFPEAATLVEHDMLAAARALHENKPGIAAILGTGSNACLYDGKKVAESLFSLGYMFGDEGSGAYLGKTYISAHLKKKVPAEIQKEFTSHYGFSDEDILTNIYKKSNPNRFLASFSVFLNKMIQHPYISELVESCFDDFFKEQVSKFSNYQQLPFGCIGSVGYNFRELVEKAAAKHNISSFTFLVSPMEGLMKYHKG